ncbi:MAG: ChrR family anti-sigma-E factor [Pseudomonadota bacterium]
MNIQTNQISDELLMGYASGALPQAFDLVVATHLSLNQAAHMRLQGFEALGGAMLEGLDEAPVADESLENVLARINGDAPEAPVLAARSDGIFPTPLKQVVGGDSDAVLWRSIGMGVKTAVVHDDEHATARLLYIPAGSEMPMHSHSGLEMTLVLQGAYSDDDGRYARGDLEIATDQDDHTPVADAGEDCICLIATDGKLKFKSWLARIAQPFIGI